MKKIKVEWEDNIACSSLIISSKRRIGVVVYPNLLLYLKQHHKNKFIAFASEDLDFNSTNAEYFDDLPAAKDWVEEQLGVTNETET